MRRLSLAGERGRLVVGNWKMNGDLAALAELKAIGQACRDPSSVFTALALPATLIAEARRFCADLIIGAQDVHAEDAGPHTGCVSATMVREAGAAFTLVGHSEARLRQAETDGMVRRKTETARRAGLDVILCVGESSKTREAGRALETVVGQVGACLPQGADGTWLAIAYEPIWAIGTGRSAGEGDVAQMHCALRSALRAALGARGDDIALLYGGSVTAANAHVLMSLPDVDGVLVGGASLTAAGFTPIIVAAHASATADIVAH